MNTSSEDLLPGDYIKLIPQMIVPCDCVVVSGTADITF
jgi:magnesium-transporting ATPase (P-type)